MEFWRESFVKSSHQPNRGCTVHAGTSKEPRLHGAAPSATTCNGKEKHFNRLANISMSCSVRKMGIAEVSSGNPKHHSAKKTSTNPWSKASIGRVIAEQGCTQQIWALASPAERGRAGLCLRQQKRGWIAAANHWRGSPVPAKWAASPDITLTPSHSKASAITPTPRAKAAGTQTSGLSHWRVQHEEVLLI